MITLTVKEKIEAALPGSKVTVYDDGADHVGHGASGAHLTVEVIFEGFEGKSLIEQHQMVYGALKEEMKQEIHALRIIAKVK